MRTSNFARRIRIAGLLAGAAVACAAPGALSTAQADVSANYDLKVTKQGDDKAVFDKDRHIFDVCDKESDNHAVYAKFSSNPDKLYYDSNSGCDRHKAPGHWYKLGAMYVCESIPYWPDSCSDGVVLKTQ
ncbi:hypothetical protein [Microlunatus soli]|uniref:Uncharacterized protein n=1 Tax=Microlunatus soli TaxID=630515 RepID=A0A1H1NUB3_9ACTN|nr:hypothetical protein [Microlunatus soli]SDS02568.1 hypothetical protein SAMN04489812_0651 [Microlunatus soli]